MNWALARTLEIDAAAEDRLLYRKDGGSLEKSLFAKVFERDFNTLEKQTAWYLDSHESVNWWHRIAVNQRSYSLQGWQRQKVYPNCSPVFMAQRRGSFVFPVLKTKGEHLKGNDDTDYKRQLFELLTRHVDSAIHAGTFDFGDAAESMSFTMLMEDSWAQDLSKLPGL